MRHPRRALGTAVEDTQTLAKLLLPGSDPQTAIKGDQRVGPPRRLVGARSTSGASSAPRHALGATVNDVLVSAVTGALTAHLDAEGEVPDEVHALVPFNLRPLDEPLPRELGNRFGLVLLGLPVGVADPVCERSRSSGGWTRSSTGTRARSRTGSSI